MVVGIESSLYRFTGSGSSHMHMGFGGLEAWYFRKFQNRYLRLHTYTYTYTRLTLFFKFTYIKTQGLESSLKTAHLS